jgi:hypothetical protein
MAFDYDKGYRGAAKDEDTNEAEYARGQQDRIQGQPMGGAGGGTDLTRLRERSAAVGRAWVEDPKGTLAAMVKVLIGFTIVGGVIGTVLGLILGDAWTKTGALTWGVNFAYVAFWFDSLITASWLIAVAFYKPTRRGLLVLLILLAALIYMAWTFVVAPTFSFMR